MAFLLNYVKRKNNKLFESLENYDFVEFQNYNPIYLKYFSFTLLDYNSFCLNHEWFIHNIYAFVPNSIYSNIYQCIIHNLKTKQIVCKPIFLKSIPLINPLKYIIGKVSPEEIENIQLPTVDIPTIIKSPSSDQINLYHNSAYVDGFFSFLNSILVNHHQFENGVNFYGSFICMKKKFKYNLTEDLTYVTSNEYFKKNKQILFTVDDYDHIIPPNTNDNGTLERKNQVLEIVDITDDDMTLEMETTDCLTFENLQSHTAKEENKQIFIDFDPSDNTDSNYNSSIESVTTANDIDENTNIEDIPDMPDITPEEDVSDSVPDGKSDDYTDESEEPIYATIPKFPINLVCMELCDDTLLSLLDDDNMNDDKWLAVLMQVIMTLLTYKHCFDFIHNDLHSGNIMFSKTDKSHLFYRFGGKVYMIPTYGKIFKIIDYGRSTYKYKHVEFCSDDFNVDENAHGQYNCPPFYNPDKPTVNFNDSFDLCRLACCLVDEMGIIPTEINPDELLKFEKILIDWTTTDNGKNIFFKSSGKYRYPDFKLYKMITRQVTKHTPSAQLERPEFKQFLVTNPKKLKQLAGTKKVFDIDALPHYAVMV